MSSLMITVCAFFPDISFYLFILFIFSLIIMKTETQVLLSMLHLYFTYFYLLLLETLLVPLLPKFTKASIKILFFIQQARYISSFRESEKVRSYSWEAKIKYLTNAKMQFIIHNYIFNFLFLSCLLVYSSWEVGKLQCFTWIKDQYDSPQTHFCAIGDGHEECNAAQSLKWPFIKVDFRPGNPNRFPGLNKGTLRSYISVMYGTPQSDEEEKQDGWIFCQP